MVGSLKNLKKLRGKSLREIRIRGGQELARIREQFLAETEITDAVWLGLIQPSVRMRTGELTSSQITTRIKNAGVQTFFPSVAHRSEIATLMATRFSSQREAIIARANRVLAGKFDLLGYDGLEFGSPVDWHLEPISNKRTPLSHWSKIDFLDPEVAGDKKITWELNRHQFLVTLGQAYWVTGDERYADCFVTLVSSWMDANPPGRGINWASSLEVAFRAISWLWAFHLFASSPRLTPKFTLRFLKFLTAFGNHVEKYLSFYFSPNTHLTGEALSLFYLGVALPELKNAEKWRSSGLKILQDQLYTQIRGDGVYFEQASYYHRYTADFYTHLLVLGRAARIALPPELEQSLAKMFDHLMWITRPNGSSSFVGDDDGGRLVMLGVRRSDDFRDTLATGVAISGRSDWKFVAAEAAVETLWLLGPDGLAQFDKVNAQLPEKLNHTFSESGYFVQRDGWLPESAYLLIDCGPHGSLGCGHAHADALSLEFSAGGVQWLTDSGTLTYTGKTELRNYFRSTAAHNTAEVDGQSQSVASGPFSWSHIAESKLGDFIATENFGYFSGSHNGYERLADPVTHTREVLFLKSSVESLMPPYLIVRDRFDAREHHRYVLNYHFSPNCRASVREVQSPIEKSDAAHRNAWQIEVASNDAGLILSSLGTAALQADVKQNWISRCYGQCQSAPMASITTAGKGTQSFATLIVPTSAQKPVNYSRQSVSPLGEGGFKLSLGNTLDTILIGDQASKLGSGFLSATGALAWLRVLGGKALHAGLVCGQRLEIQGCLEFVSKTVVNHCSVEFRKDWLELSLNGTDKFDLVFHSPVSRVVINGVSFSIERRVRRASFEQEANGWQLKLAQLAMS
ncbi:MAG TPA: alginate lyase family protein [Blastocatellia bacterium]|nr:alginate lyase family protein [Blastocatellia bacterium]